MLKAGAIPHSLGAGFQPAPTRLNTGIAEKCPALGLITHFQTTITLLYLTRSKIALFFIFPNGVSGLLHL